MERLFTTKTLKEKLDYWTSGKKAYDVAMSPPKKIIEVVPDTVRQTKWRVAKELLSKKLFPNNVDFGKEVLLGEIHNVGKREHSLKSYHKYLTRTGGFETKAVYNICPKCDAEIRNKYLVMFNDDLGRCCIKWFVKSGQEV